MLTPDEKGRLATNFKGYDISPDMVRLSLVNMYLHGFVAPRIHEYDTLTSDDRWNEYADVILANPPFMSPKGGIRPHNRFSVKSRRSEVLFVDYMAEHLTPGGRAGIIVPEGTIFQSQNAHRQLRKMLVEDYLVAVVSLPAGVFNPYSGVKTSILILDKSLAKKTDRIAFFKVENDGYDLGAQRRPIDRDDLPQACAELTEYLQRLRTREGMYSFQTTLGLVVGKDRIAADGKYDLGGERYRDNITLSDDWPMVSLGMIADIESGSRQKGGGLDSGIPSIGGQQIDDKGNIRFNNMKYISEKHFHRMKKGILKRNDVLIVKDGATTGKVGYFPYDIPSAVNEHVFILRAKATVHPYYLFSTMQSDVFQENLQPFIKGVIGGINLEIRDIQIPLPPLTVQKKIVTELEMYQKVIDGARAVVDNYRPHIAIDPAWPVVEKAKIAEGGEYNLSGERYREKEIRQSNWPLVKVRDVCDVILSGGTPSTKNEVYWKGNIPWITSADIVDLKTAKPRKYITEEAIQESATNLIRKGSVIVVTRVGLGKLFRNDFDVCISQDSQGLIVKAGVDADYLVYVLKDRVDNFKQISQGSTIQGVTKSQLSEIQIPLPPLEVQREIVAEIEAEQALVDANRELIERFERKIQDTIARVWDEN